MADTEFEETCVICEEALENTNDEICPTCADDIRVEEGSPYDDVVINPDTGEVYSAWGYDPNANFPKAPNLPPGWVP